MPNCPRCDQPISSKAIACPHCKTVLKAYGHPGITLHRATGDAPLCNSCTYHADDTCTFPQRPYAQECTLYHDITKPLVDRSLPAKRRPFLQSLKLWCQRNPGLLGFLGIGVVSVLLALISTSK